MSLSEHEAEERLAQLRRQREALDREIADLVLYLELGRRLHAGVPRSSAPAPAPFEDRPHGAVPAPRPNLAPAGDGLEMTGQARVREEMGVMPAAPVSAPAPPQPAEPLLRSRRPGAPEPVAFADDPTGARRYGRALIEAACAVIAAAGRPLHAREIHDALIVRGYAIPGRDPVAALNTRLWKRSGEGGPLRRHGEAIYALADG